MLLPRMMGSDDLGEERFEMLWRDADAMLNSGKDLAAEFQALELSESTLERWRSEYCGMKSAEARRMKELEDEPLRLKYAVTEQALDVTMLKHLEGGKW